MQQVNWQRKIVDSHHDHDNSIEFVYFLKASIYVGDTNIYGAYTTLIVDVGYQKENVTRLYIDHF